MKESPDNDMLVVPEDFRSEVMGPDSRIQLEGWGEDGVSPLTEDGIGPFK